MDGEQREQRAERLVRVRVRVTLILTLTLALTLTRTLTLTLTLTLTVTLTSTLTSARSIEIESWQSVDGQAYAAPGMAAVCRKSSLR